MGDVKRAYRHLARQIDHWTSAAARLSRLEDLAGPESWGRLEQYLGVSLRDHLRMVVDRTTARGDLLRAALVAAETEQDLAAVRRQLQAFRSLYLRAEMTVDFYADAVNTRTNAVQGALLRACDTLAYRSMAGVLEPIGYETPIALTYLDKGLGASILKAGLRLWDGGAFSAAAAIKIARHNFSGRPTALVHEAGHQVAHIAGWNDDLARTLEAGLGGSPTLARIWADWASEIAADAIAFVHTGYGSVVALHDVLAGERGFVFQMVPRDPHPMSFLRVELGIQMCRLAWGDGPWDDLEAAWREAYPLESASTTVQALAAASMPLIPTVARLTLATGTPALRGRSLIDIVSPDRVSPRALGDLKLKLGPALYTSSHWIWTESLRLLALSALEAVDRTLSGGRPAASEDWMLQLGGFQQAA
jgi:hypothetical protein